MAQFIEADNTLPSQIHLAKDDVLLVRAFGAQLESGHGVVELLGPMPSAILQASGFGLSPEGPPNAILFIARELGTAKANVFFGDPFFSSQETALKIVVE